MSDYLCDLFLETVKKMEKLSPNLIVTTEKRSHPKECIVDFQTKAFNKYAERKSCEIQKASSLAYDQKKNVVSGEVLIPHCASPRRGCADFLVRPKLDLCGDESCKIEEIHNHCGKCPTTHVHIKCDLDKVVSKKDCIDKIALWIGTLSEVTKENCG